MMIQELIESSQPTVEWLAAFALSSMTLSAFALLAIRFQRSASASMRFSISQAAMTGVLALAVICAVLPGVVILPVGPASIAKTVTESKPVHARLDELSQKIVLRPMNTEFIIPSTAGAKAPSAFAPPRASTAVEPPSVATTSFTLEIAVLKPLNVSVWLAGCLFLLLRFLSSVVSAYRNISRVTFEVTHDQQLSLERAIGEMKIPHPLSIRLAVSPEIPVPYTIGMLRPVIVLPVESRTWSAAKTRMVLKHEIAHVQRRDVVWCWINHVSCSLAWFNPLVWVLSRRCVLEREQACDDLVLKSGAEPTDYGTNLVEIGASLSGRSVNLRGAVAMTEPPLKRRLASVLSPRLNRQSMSPKSRWLVIGGFALAVMILGVLRPFGQSTATAQMANPADASHQDAEPSNDLVGQPDKPTPSAKPKKLVPVAIPDSVSGRVHDPGGGPIAGATVHVQWIQQFTGQDKNEYLVDVLKEWEVTSDGRGRFTIDTSGIKELRPAQFLRAVRVTVKGFALARSGWLSGPDLASGRSFDLSMLPGRRILAHVLTSDLRPAGGAVVKAAGTPGEPNKSWWMEGETISEDGMLSMYVPVEMDVEMMVYAQDQAPQRVKLGWDDSVLGKIVLKKGTRVHGKVLDRDGKAVAGTVVELQTYEGNELEGLAFGVCLAVKTGQAGNFELPPCRGNCALSVTMMGHDFSKLGQMLVKGVAPPVILPVELMLDGKSTKREVNLRQGPTVTIEGVAKWSDGRPVVGMGVKGGAMLRDSGVHIAFATTGADGRYKLEMPIPLADAYVNAFGEKDSQGVFHMAHGQSVDAAMASEQFISFRPLEGNIQNADWELRVFQPSPRPPVSTTEADKALEKLQEKAGLALTAYQEALQKATTFEEQNRVYDQLDPRNLMASPYLAMEAKYRGTRAGFEALVEVARAARSVGDPMSAAAQGRIEAVDRLIAHYLKHEQLDATFRAFDGGPEVARADEFLQAALDNNPHRKVQVAALVAQINAIKSQLRQVAQAFEFRPKLAEMMAQVPAPVRAETERRIAELESIDTEQLRAEANKKLRRLASQYANEPLDYYGTAGHAAKSLSHAINNVVVGQAAPEIAATDINGKPFRLSDQKGKVVLLWFTQDLFDNYAEFYEPMRGLASTYSDKPLQIVGIMSNHKQEHLKAAAKRGDLPWTVIPQTLNGPVQRDWGCDAYPTLYLVDHEGILHGSLGMAYGTDDADTTQIESQIDELLSKVSPAK